MPLLQALVRCSITALFLSLCLQLVTGQDDEYDNRKPLIVQMSPLPTAKVNETRELRCNVSTQLKECVAIKFSIYTSPDTSCSQFFQQEACICPGDPPRNFFWNICSQRTVATACLAEIIDDRERCYPNLSVVPTASKRSYAMGKFIVTK
ncbi:prolactin-inducible protein [Notamacropus eugenii]|uniref:prolactin-inducible protein n=1 Tax=Notamacropus eugenii TaxID=9315 RepID=UPI003B67AD5E